MKILFKCLFLLFFLVACTTNEESVVEDKFKDFSCAPNDFQNSCKMDVVCDDFLNEKCIYNNDIEDAKIVAENYIKNLKEYKQSGVNSFELVHMQEGRCENCNIFYFQFDSITTGKIYGFQFNVEIKNNSINNIEKFFMYDEVEKITPNECTTTDDCETPMEYMVRSNCPYTSECIGGFCNIICPIIVREDFYNNSEN